MKLKKKTFVMGICTLMMLLCTSCDTAMAVLAGMADGMTGYGMTSGYVPTSYSSAYSDGMVSSSSLSSSSSTCRRCGGSGACQTCKGTGQVYDYGSASVVSKKKYTHKCGVCNGTVWGLPLKDLIIK